MFVKTRSVLFCTWHKKHFGRGSEFQAVNHFLIGEGIKSVSQAFKAKTKWEIKIKI